jgi:hypothetical protein
MSCSDEKALTCGIVRARLSQRQGNCQSCLRFTGYTVKRLHKDCVQEQGGGGDPVKKLSTQAKAGRLLAGIALRTLKAAALAFLGSGGGSVI